MQKLKENFQNILRRYFGAAPLRAVNAVFKEQLLGATVR